MAEVRVKGLAELHAAMQSLPAKIEANVTRGALRAAARVVRDAARANVPVKTGALRDSIRISARMRGGKISTRVVAGNRAAWYAHLVERGTTAHLIEPRGDGALQVGDRVVERVHHPGSSAKPFMRPAVDSKMTEATQAAASYVRARLKAKHGIDVPDPGAPDESSE